MAKEQMLLGKEAPKYNDPISEKIYNKLGPIKHNGYITLVMLIGKSLGVSKISWDEAGWVLWNETSYPLGATDDISKQIYNHWEKVYQNSNNPR